MRGSTASSTRRRGSGVLTSLMAHPKGLVFADLKRLCGLTDGNLSRHLQVLQEAGLVEISRATSGNRPQTICRITPSGRRRFLELSQRARTGRARCGRAQAAFVGDTAPLARVADSVLFFAGDFTMQSTLECRRKLHVAIIMDGNGRWATRARAAALGGTPRGRRDHAAGRARRRSDLGVGTLTLYAFSADNWRRPPAEVASADGAAAPLSARRNRKAARQRHAADRHRPARPIAQRSRRGLADAEAATAAGEALHLRIALDYSSRDAILQRRGRRRRCATCLTREAFGRLLSGRRRQRATSISLIRTGGEKRLSDFLLWECAYAELHFTDRMWPDFDADDLATALTDFHGRERRFGAVGVAEVHAGLIPSAA